MSDTNYPKEFLRLLKPRLPEMLSTLQKLVLAESPSLEKEPADRCCDMLAAEWRKRGARVERHRAEESRRPASHHMVARKNRGPPASSSCSATTTPSIPPATLAKMPFRVSGGKAYGPGIFDMKAGLTQALFALDALQQTKVPLTPSAGLSLDLRRRDRQRCLAETHRNRSSPQRCRLCIGAFARPERPDQDRAQRRRRSRTHRPLAAPLTQVSRRRKASTQFTNCRANSRAFRSGTICVAA